MLRRCTLRSSCTGSTAARLLVELSSGLLGRGSGRFAVWHLPGVSLRWFSPDSRARPNAICLVFQPPRRYCRWGSVRLSRWPTASQWLTRAMGHRRDGRHGLCRPGWPCGGAVACRQARATRWRSPCMCSGAAGLASAVSSTWRAGRQASAAGRHLFGPLLRRTGRRSAAAGDARRARGLDARTVPGPSAGAARRRHPPSCGGCQRQPCSTSLPTALPLSSSAWAARRFCALMLRCAVPRKSRAIPPGRTAEWAAHRRHWISQEGPPIG